MSGASTYKEHLQNNEKELNLSNIVFDARQFFNPSQNFMDPHHPRHAKILWTHATHATHAKLQPTPLFLSAPKIFEPTPPANQRPLATHATHAI